MNIFVAGHQRQITWWRLMATTIHCGSETTLALRTSGCYQME